MHLFLKEPVPQVGAAERKGVASGGRFVHPVVNSTTELGIPDALAALGDDVEQGADLWPRYSRPTQPEPPRVDVENLFASNLRRRCARSVDCEDPACTPMVSFDDAFTNVRADVSRYLGAERY